MGDMQCINRTVSTDSRCGVPVIRDRRSPPAPSAYIAGRGNVGRGGRDARLVGGDPDDLPEVEVVGADDVAFADPAAAGGPDQCLGGVVDADRFRAHPAQPERQLAQGGSGHEGPVRGGFDVAGAVGVGDTHRDHRHATPGGVERRALARNPRQHIGIRGRGPVERIALRRRPTPHPTDGAHTRGVDEPFQIVAGGDVEDPAQDLDIGAPQRFPITNPRAGVDDGVDHPSGTRHRPRHRVGVVEFADDGLDVEAVEHRGVRARPHHHPHRCARLGAGPAAACLSQEATDHPRTEETGGAEHRGEGRGHRGISGARSASATAARCAMAANMASPRAVGRAAPAPNTTISGAWMRLPR